jgi:hypothetical protein
MNAFMSKLSTLVPLAGCLFITGCGKPASVPPVIEPNAYAKQLADGTYEVQLRHSVTSSGGPCLGKDFFKTWTSYSTNWIYLKALEGKMTADQIVVTTDAGKKEWPYATTNMQGTVSFVDDTMTVQLEAPSYPDGVHMQGYVQFYLNGIYQVVTNSSPYTAPEPTATAP